MPPPIAVALATCNGARFLPELLHSIAAQTVSAGPIIAGDDGSTDATLACLTAGGCRLLGSPASRRPQNQNPHDTPQPNEPPSPPPRLGPAANFNRVLAASDAPWTALCDQDDLWETNRLATLAAVADRQDASVPTLIVHDLALIDAAGAPIAPSYWSWQAYDPQRGSNLRTLLVMNSFPGCAMIANRALLDRALPIPADAVMHDWWLALVAAACGQIVVVPQALVRYRQHGENVMGAKRFRWWPRAGAGPAAELQRAARQAQALAQRLAGRVTPDAAGLMRAVAGCAGAGWCQRRLRLQAAGITKIPWSRHLGFLLRA